jgi:hypothetical protein
VTSGVVEEEEDEVVDIEGLDKSGFGVDCEERRGGL